MYTSHDNWYQIRAKENIVQGVEERIISCIAAGVSFASIRTAYAKKPECKLRIALPEPGKRYHDWWIVPKVTSID